MDQPLPKPADHWRVNIDEPWEVRFWTRELGCSEEALREAVVAAGPRAGPVREYLSRRPANRRPTEMIRTPDPADSLRVFLHEPDIAELVSRFPKLSRTEIVDVVSASGPMRQLVERELARLSARKS